MKANATATRLKETLKLNQTALLVAGKRPVWSTDCTWKYLEVPTIKINIPQLTNIVPKIVLAECMNLSLLSMSRNSWVRATPTLAKVRPVLNHARNVRSFAKWSLATDWVFSNVTPKYISNIIGVGDEMQSSTSLTLSELGEYWTTIRNSAEILWGASGFQ